MTDRLWDGVEFHDHQGGPEFRTRSYGMLRPECPTKALRSCILQVACAREMRARGVLPAVDLGRSVAGVLTLEAQIQLLSRRLGFDDGGSDAVEPLIAAEAARRLDLPIKGLLRLVYERKIRYVMLDGIAHIPEDALDEYRRQATS